jgi:hypothetical protein
MTEILNIKDLLPPIKCRMYKEKKCSGEGCNAKVPQQCLIYAELIRQELLGDNYPHLTR